MKAFLWPEQDAELASRSIDHVIERAGLSLADAVADHETAVFVHSSARALRAATIQDLVEAWRACAGDRPLHVAVAPDRAVRWHLFELAHKTLDEYHAWNPEGLRLEIPKEALGARYWVDAHCYAEGRRSLWHDARWGELSGSLEAVDALVVRVGSARLQSGDEELAGFDPGPLPEGESLQLRVAVLDCGESEADWRVPYPMPGYIAYDAPSATWRNLRAGGAPITGRQNAPEILKVTPSVMVGTGAQFQRWRELVAAGEARGVRIEVDEAVDGEAA